MSTAFFYAIAGVLIFCIGLHGMLAYAHLLRKALGMNIMGTGIFLFLVAFANRSPNESPDPVPHGMVLTGIVVAVCATAFILAMTVSLYMRTGATDFESILSKHNEEEES
jgi:multicomponent Na+:H+ antiporter subunit C